jgi:prolyl-tRNA synthetase
MQKNIREVKDFDEFKQIMDDKRGFIKTHWCKSLECERYVKEQTGATLRCIPFSKESVSGKCIVCNKETDTIVYFAKSY